MAIDYLAANRFGLGHHPDDAVSTSARAAQAALERQLGAFEPSPQAIAALPGPREIAETYILFREQGDAMAGKTGAATTADERGREPAARREAREAIRLFYIDAAAARFAAAVASPTPFAERLVHFWANHFAVSTEKQFVSGLAGNYEFSAIRPHIMGRFSDLLIAATRHPAMQLYLDQVLSVGPDSPFAVRQSRPRGRPGLNENLAREILELHTLGVRSGYTQADVTAFARALTGLSVAGLGRGALRQLVPDGSQPGDSIYIAERHQPGDQMILGKRYPDTGPQQAEAVLRDLAAHPATARHIATRLARHFTADDPPPPLVDRLAADFLRSGGDLPSLYRTLIASPEPWQGGPAMFKSPWDWTVSMARGLPVPMFGERQNVPDILGQLGQQIWRPESPAGFGDTVATWAGSGGLMQRVDLASRITARIGDRVDARTLAPQILGDALTADLAEAIAGADSPAQGLAMLFASPAFLRR